jgi:RimJ/RimL family protein N-acetyltransferase
MLKFRKANINDLDLYFNWSNERLVRLNSFNSKSIEYQDHCKWFKSKLSDPDFEILIFQDILENNIGQVKFEKTDNLNATIGISIDPLFRGNKYACTSLKIAIKYFLNCNNNITINAFIKNENSSSIKSFENAGFVLNKKFDNKYLHYFIKK